jgi:hypothetical protein
MDSTCMSCNGFDKDGFIFERLARLLDSDAQNSQRNDENFAG